MANYAIGDVQGCFSGLQALLELINFNSRHDRLWFTGDLINRGPQSLDTLRFIINLPNQPVVVLGNHDLHILAVAHGKAALKAMDTCQDLLTAPDCGQLLDWLRHQPLFYYDQTLSYALVHAGLYPQWTIVKALEYAAEVEHALQSSTYQHFLQHMYGNHPLQWSEALSGWERVRFIVNSFTRMRFCSLTGHLELTTKQGTDSAPEGYMAWFAVPDRLEKDKNILFGHWASLKGKVNQPNVYALDTGYVWGGALTAMRLEDKAYFTVANTR